MMEFKNVTVLKKANIFFDGRVTSRTLLFPNGERKTLGIMLPGEYEFSTGDKEVMEMLGGSVDVLLPGCSEYCTFSEGESFEISAKSTFKLIVKAPADYCCSYIKESWSAVE